MPYDYSLRFLAKHAALVEELKKLATTGAVKGWESDRWEVIREQQALVNNVLASMSRNISDMKQIREVMACWTAFGENGNYQLFVGHWTKKPRKGAPTISRTYVPAEDAAGLVYRHLDQGKDALETFTDFATKLRNLDISYKKAEIELPLETRVADPKDMVEWAEDQFTGWRVRLDGINLILERS